MSVVAFLEAFDPTGGRCRAFREAINSLNALETPLDAIYVMGSGGYERKCRGWSNVIYNQHENMPLSDKRQASMEAALASGADYLLSWGSDDLVHPGYLTRALKDIEGHDWVGVDRWWLAYYDAESESIAYQRCEYVDRMDPMGAGRLYRTDFIREKCPTMWAPGRSYSLDANNARLLEAAGARLGYTSGHITLPKGPWESLTKLYHFYNTELVRFLPADKHAAAPVIVAHDDVLARILTAPADTVKGGPSLRDLARDLNASLNGAATVSARRPHPTSGDVQFTVHLGGALKKRPIRHYCYTVSCQELPVQLMYVLNVKCGLNVRLDAALWTGAALREEK